ncbi:hypothetical protein BC826DRAFT_976274 [Russula brevipes]|nr:hypothetical protein BC826DRAFT_976274 [Russula brevipes]
MTSSAALIRALSPSLAAVTAAVQASGPRAAPANAARDARHFTILGASSVRTSLIVQSFADTEQRAAYERAAVAALLKYNTELLDQQCSARRDEVAALVAETSLEHLVPLLQREVLAHAPSVIEANQVLKPSGTVMATLPLAIRDNTLEDCSVYASRVVAITQAALNLKSIKINKKRNVAEQARTAAGDMDVDGEGETSSAGNIARTKTDRKGKGNADHPKKGKSAERAAWPRQRRDTTLQSPASAREHSQKSKKARETGSKQGGKPGKGKPRPKPGVAAGKKGGQGSKGKGKGKGRK